MFKSDGKCDICGKEGPTAESQGKQFCLDCWLKRR
jgi:hypothetical protein